MDIEQLRQGHAVYQEHYMGVASAEFEDACRRIYWDAKQAETKDGSWIGPKIPSKAEYRKTAWRWSHSNLTDLLLIPPPKRDVMVGAGAFIYAARIFESIELQEREREEKAARARREHWLALGWDELEWETVKLFRGLGYEAIATKGSGDKGVDVLATRKDRKVIVQCKQHGKPVGSPDVSRLAGAMLYHEADEGILVAPRGFSAHAIDFAANCGVDLWDAHDLASKVPREEDDSPISVPVELVRPPPVSPVDRGKFADGRLSILGFYAVVTVGVIGVRYDSQQREIKKALQRAEEAEREACYKALPVIPGEHPMETMWRRRRACRVKP